MGSYLSTTTTVIASIAIVALAAFSLYLDAKGDGDQAWWIALVATSLALIYALIKLVMKFVFQISV